MYNVTNPKTGKTYTFNSGNLRRANNLASKLGVRVVKAYNYTYRDGSTDRITTELDWTGNLNFGPPRGSPCPHGSTYGFCDRGACDE